MSDSKDAAKKDAKDAKAEAKGPKAAPLMILTLVASLCGAFAGSAAFGAARLASSHGGGDEKAVKMTPPGPTVALEPFLATVNDASGKSHTVKVTIAVELERDATEEEFKVFVPRVRDTTLSYLRSLTWDDMRDPARAEPMRDELLEKWHAAGAVKARRVLVTDLITP
ncbi:MAG: flagellar basal body-associated FliL family protein [Polyangiaceae bacterium]